MRVLITGGREFDSWDMTNRALTDLFVNEVKDGDMVIIQGGAKGADFLGKVWAKYRASEGCSISVEEYAAEWKKHGRAAGMIRNQEMLETNPDVVVAFPGGRGTADMVKRAENAGIRVIKIDS